MTDTPTPQKAARFLFLAAIIGSIVISGYFTSMNFAYGASVDVTVTITRVIELSCPTLEVDCPNDYYASVSIAGQDYQSSTEITSTDFSPSWTFTRTVDTSSGSIIPIVIELWDSDTLFDDQVDIDPRVGGIDLDLTFDIASGRWSGDVPDNQRFAEGTEGDNKAKIFFDITLSGDIDDDGIPDGVEIFGVLDESGNPIPIVEGLGFPMNPCRKTVAVQLDYMAAGPDGHSHHPLKTNALQYVIEAFNNAPVDAVSDCPYTGYSANSGVNLVIDISKTVPHLEHTVDGYSFANGKFFQAKADNFDPAREPYFRYALWQNQGATASGTNFFVGEVGPNKPIALGGVFMHELGHTLGLAHGGNAESENCKPNYHSVMNYAYGLYLTKFVGGDPTKRVELLDYSRSKLLDLNEIELFESQGINDGDFLTVWGTSPTERKFSYTGSGPLDWDGDGIIDDIPTDFTAGVSVEVDLNNSMSQCPAVDTQQTLYGFNDWENLDFNFRDGSGNAPPPPHEETPVSEADRITEMLDEPPTITAPPDVEVVANTAGGAVVELGVPTVSDNLDANPTVINDAPSVFPIGTTTVTWTASDFFGNSASDTQLVTVKRVMITMDIKPKGLPNSINTKTETIIPVGIPSSATFNAISMIDTTSLTFGKTGDEISLISCNKDDFNRDKLPDLICKFETKKTALILGDVTGILRGTFVDGIPFEGSDSVNIVK